MTQPVAVGGGSARTTPAGARSGGAEYGARWLVPILIVALVLRAGYALLAWQRAGSWSVFHSPDSPGYIALAEGLARAGAFEAAGMPEMTLTRTPGYPLLLVPGVLAGAPEPVTVALQILLSLATLLGVFFLARRFGGAAVATVAAALYAVETVSVTHAPLILSETLFTAALTWSLYLLTGYLGESRPGALFAGIALLAAAAYVRPAGYYLPFCVLGFLAIRHGWRGEWRRLAPLALALLLALAIILPWEARNRARGFDGFSAISSENLYFYMAGAVLAERAGRTLGEQQREMGYLDEERYLGLHPERRGWSRGERYDRMAAEGAGVIRGAPGEYARIHLRGMGRLALDPGFQEVFRTTGLYPEEGGGVMARVRSDGAPAALAGFLRDHAAAAAVILVLTLMLLATYLLAGYGVVVGRLWRHPAALALLCTIAYLVAIGGGPVGYARFRHPVMPLLCVLAAIGLVAARDRWHARRLAQGAPPATSPPPPRTESR